MTVNFGNRGVGDGVDHLRAVFGDAALLVLPSDHEPGDVLQEEERDLPARAHLDEMRCLQGRLGEEDSVVGDDARRGTRRGARSRRRASSP